jgi:transcriptional regulator with XRE-family HTH domain
MFDRLDQQERQAMGERLQGARLLAGLMIREVAKSQAVSVNSVHNWERGAVPNSQLRAALAALYKVDEDILFAEIAARRAHAESLLSA